MLKSLGNMKMFDDLYDNHQSKPMYVKFLLFAWNDVQSNGIGVAKLIKLIFPSMGMY